MVCCNFIYPLLLVLSTVTISLALLLLFSILGVIIARKMHDYRLNLVILSLYPVFFILCFVIFRFITGNKVLVYTQIACFAILLFGSIHHFIFMIYRFGRTAYRHFKKIKKVTPSLESTSKTVLTTKKTS